MTACDRECSRKKACGRDREARKRAAKKIPEASCAQKENPGIETETRRAKETAGEDRDLGRIFVLNTSGDAICDESFGEETIHAMKKAIILGSAFSILALMLVACSSEPDTPSPPTRQPTATPAPPPPVGQTTTTTTHRTGGGY